MDAGSEVNKKLREWEKEYLEDLWIVVFNSQGSGLNKDFVLIFSLFIMMFVAGCLIGDIISLTASPFKTASFQPTVTLNQKRKYDSFNCSLFLIFWGQLLVHEFCAKDHLS